MSRTGAALAAAGLVLASVLTGGCTVSADDQEEARPAPRTVTAAPTTPPRPLPARIPVGTGAVAPSDVVWAQGSTLHVGHRSVDVSPTSIDAFVVVRGGIYFTDRGELWYTDLVRVRGAGVTGVTALATTADASAIRVRVDDGAGSSAAHAWSTRTGAPVPLASAPAATPVDYLGRPVEVVLRPTRSDVAPADPRRPVTARVSSGGYGIVGGDGGPLRAYRTATRQLVELSGVTGDGFELVRWRGPTTFYGLALRRGRPYATLGCRLESGSCTTWGTVVRGEPLVFESGT